MKTSKGFSLVELAIVLVIIGLITGGILTGQELIRASELNAVQADFNKMQTAINTFKLKYNDHPGDLSNATAYWGTASGGCPNGARSGTQTCNGDRDGFIDNDTHEMYLVWQHLSLSGLIPGNYTGVYAGAISAGIVPGTNMPSGKISNSVFMIRHLGQLTGNPNLFDGMYNNYYEFGGNCGAYPYACPTILNATEAASIDTKMDDGKPAFGKIRGATSTFWTTNCVTTAVASTAAWAVSASTQSCALVYLPN